VFGGLGVGWLLVTYVPNGPRELLFGIFATAWFVVSVVLMFRIAFFLCPRCGHPFFVTWLYGNIFSGKCLHCGLRKYGDNNE